MKHKLLADDAGERTFILVLDEGDEAFGCITAFAEREGVTAASITAIGAFRVATIAFFEFQTKTYRKIPVEVQSEVLSMLGDVAVDDAGKASLHLHVVLGSRTEARREVISWKGMSAPLWRSCCGKRPSSCGGAIGPISA